VILVERLRRNGFTSFQIVSTRREA
jgi:hypothetical protein